MARALALAARGRGKVSPNPMVGAVIVKKGRVIAEGYHRGPGEDHAEVAALKKVGQEAKGATVYVTLEPCCHTGNTGPCTEALISAGVRKVVFASTDPDPRVNGKGARRLRKAGVEVIKGVLASEAERLNESYYGFNRNGRPFVILKIAQTLDGRIAARNGDSQWVSGPKSLKMVHRLRSEVDAVAVGMGTVRADNPSLTVRHVKGRNPYRLIVTGSAKFPKGCHLLTNNSDYKTIVASGSKGIDRLAQSRNRNNLIYWSVKSRKTGGLDVADLVSKAGEFGLRSILVEGGAALATSFIRAGLVDKLILVVAPKVLGSGIEAVADLGLRKLSDAVAVRDLSVERVGEDLVCTGYPVWKA
ncbi:MAG: bifunctional diaminohydroxyphosphoribosylaminopyrimidine deaminase/5-amino-6-(5-phosphoribosylamino)uracil reductase RibD [bacterium]|nr:bifunctional diaminohydroxyphosphoribosylaminopyrimidine deaminase/5-amino-6-(5-phosphoribosylamino)uracil reductase RibD [bacterium]